MESRPVGCAAIFFGTPFPTKVDPGRFKKALRDCALIEGCIDNDVQLDMTDKGVQDMIDMVRRHMQHLNGPASLAFFEAQESAYRKRYGFLGNKKRVVSLCLIRARPATGTLLIHTYSVADYFFGSGATRATLDPAMSRCEP